ncbi:MAG: restriction endonuclease, SacI family, partial [Planctomycetaceae bacterium]|nr:restriction endonuclease, SacI family [Planctomycetaceae bacterium]
LVNKPARHPEHSKDNTQLRNKPLAANLHQALELAHKATPDEAFAMLVYTLRLGKARAASQVTATVEVETTHQRVVAFVQAFLKESDGGSRLAAVVGAIIRLMNEGHTVKVYPPNYSDRFAKTSGDVEIHHAKATISAFECKHRPISIDDVRHGIKKAKENGVPEYWFVGAVGLATGQEKEIQDEIRKSGERLDLHLIDILRVLPTWAALLNPVRRGQFGAVVAEILRDDMHRSEVANQAADLWNELE